LVLGRVALEPTSQDRAEVGIELKLVGLDQLDDADARDRLRKTRDSHRAGGREPKKSRRDCDMVRFYFRHGFRLNLRRLDHKPWTASSGGKPVGRCS
jgi:hypothetical protein